MLAKIYQEGHADIFPFHLFMDPWASRLEPLGHKNMESNIAVFQNGGVVWFTEGKEQTAIAKALLERMTGSEFFEEVRDKTSTKLDEMEKLSARLEKTNFFIKSDAELAAAYEDYCAKVADLNGWGTLVTLMEMGHESVITDALYVYLRKKGEEAGSPEKVGESIGILSTPTEPTYLRHLQKDLLEAAIVVRESGKSGLDQAARGLHKKYAWINYGYVGPALPEDYFKKEVERLSKEGNLESQLAILAKEDQTTKIRQAELEAFFRFDAKGRRLFEIARTFMFQKEYRKQILYHSFYALQGLRKEIAKRGRISQEQLAYAMPEEIKSILAGDFDASSLGQRAQFCVYLPRGRKVLVGKEAKKAAEGLFEEKQFHAEMLSGQCAFCGGKVTAPARIVVNLHDLWKLQEGDVLVSPATSPAMVPAMKKAGAIVTDQGGVTCHAAIVSRELKIPCITGTKFATKVFKDGDLLEVDSLAGTVRKNGAKAEPLRKK